MNFSTALIMMNAAYNHLYQWCRKSKSIQANVDAILKKLGKRRGFKYVMRIYDLCGGSYLCFNKQIGKFVLFLDSLRNTLNLEFSNENVEKFFTEKLEDILKGNFGLNYPNMNKWYYWLAFWYGNRNLFREKFPKDLTNECLKSKKDVQSLEFSYKKYTFKILDNIHEILYALQEVVSCFSPPGVYALEALYFYLSAKNLTLVAVYRDNEIFGRVGIAFDNKNKKFVITSKVYGVHSDLLKIILNNLKKKGYKKDIRVPLYVIPTDYLIFPERHFMDDKIEWTLR